MSEVLNANPTIRNASDLPTRRSRPTTQKTRQSPLELFTSSIPSSHHSNLFNPPSPSSSDSDNDNTPEPIDEQEIYDLISTISDPEHPLSLGSLAVVNLPDITIKPLFPHSASPSPTQIQTVLVEITPTITHCSLATVIGLGVRVRLEQSLPPRYRVDVRIKDGTHSTGDQVNKQLGDKERVAAALENAQLIGVLRKMLETCQ